MESELTARLAELEKKIDAVHRSAEKTRKYFLWTIIITAATVLLPLIGLSFVLPQFLSTYSANSSL